MRCSKLMVIMVLCSVLLLAAGCRIHRAPHLDRGDTYFETGHWDEAITEYTQAIAE